MLKTSKINGLKNRVQGFKGPSNCGLPNAECAPSPFPSPHWGEGRVRGVPKSKGMTFVEVILVLALVGILSAVVIPKVGYLASTGPSVDGAAQMVASDIRYAQEFAMANRVSKSVNFTASSSVYTFSPTSSLDPSGQLPSGVTINNNYTITFNSLGEPITGGGGSVTVSGGGLSKTISVVNYTGKVNI